MEGKLVPYVTKLFERIERAARHCIVQVSRGDSYEVELNGDTVLVDIGQMTCTCYHWQLTRIPCVHGFACILDKRVDPEDFVDVHYIRQKYLYAYEELVKPMPGPKHWEKHHFTEPLPPAVRVMPGRPKLKKRKLERGEGAPESSGRHPKPQKRQKRCGNCG
ncbi:uncharacterized protein LOC110694313 [Chenopodium quinoa]|uniref:uncharacterized protein LOC110694313 n=1 Tax=Chenopodium quinoa TaxID=63459 RepID=UPI000B79624B|nr:uncharacterized protein LOC110694313 [Chenopodium quinoa]